MGIFDFLKKKRNSNFSDGTSVSINNGSSMTWIQLIETIHASMKKKDDITILNLQKDYKIQMAFWGLFINRFKDDSAFYTLPFEYNDSVIVRAKKYQNGEKSIKDPAMLMLHQDMTTYKPKYFITGNGQIGRETNAIGNYDRLLVEVCSYLKGRSVSMNNLTPLALEAIGHYMRIPVVSYFFALPSLTGSFSAKPDEINQMEVSIYTGTESLLLEMYGELSNGSVITDESVIKKVESLFVNVN